MTMGSRSVPSAAGDARDGWPDVPVLERLALVGHSVDVLARLVEDGDRVAVSRETLAEPRGKAQSRALSDRIRISVEPNVPAARMTCLARISHSCFSCSGLDGVVSATKTDHSLVALLDVGHGRSGVDLGALTPRLGQVGRRQRVLRTDIAASGAVTAVDALRLVNTVAVRSPDTTTVIVAGLGSS